MADLYYRLNSVPAPLPAYIYDEEGNAFSEPFSRKIIEIAGFFPAPLKPENVEGYVIKWDIDNNDWIYFKIPEPPETDPLDLVPMEVTAAQAQVALYNAGLLELVEENVANHPYPPIRIWFRSATKWRRDNPYVLGMAAELGISDEQFLDLFTNAGKVVT